MGTNGNFANKILAISDDLSGDAVDWLRMEVALDASGPVGMTRLSDKVWRIAEPLLPAGVIVAPGYESLAALQSMLAAVFTMGIVYGREHVHRGYDLPRG